MKNAAYVCKLLLSLLGRQKNSSKGFTLMELLVYIAIVGVVIIIAGQAFSNSSKIRVRTQSMVKASEVAGNVGVLLKDDVAQMGAKSSKEGTADASDVFLFQSSVYMDPTNTDNQKRDSSSFRVVNQKTGCGDKGCNTDTLVLRRVRYDTLGRFEAVDEVKWFLRNDKLFRMCKTIGKVASASASDETPVEIAEKVSRFKVVVGKPGLVSTAIQSAAERASILPDTDPTVTEFRLVPRYGEDDFYFLSTVPEDGGESVDLRGFASNYDVENNEPILDGKKANQVFVAQANSTSGTWKDLCKKVTLEANVEYEISFSITYRDDDNRMFCPGRDYASVGFRDMDGKKIEHLSDFGFYPPASNTEQPQRKMRFSVGKTVNDVCMAFTFASYSPVVAVSDNMTMTFQGVSLKKVESSNYNFEDEDYEPLIVDKKNVKALLIKFSVDRNGESGESNQVVLVPSNGPRD